MIQIQQPIQQMNESAVRTLLRQAYRSSSQGEARIVTQDGEIHSIGNHDPESYSIQAEHANDIIQRCQSRLRALHTERLGRQWILHNLISTLTRQQQHQHALRRALY